MTQMRHGRATSQGAGAALATATVAVLAMTLSGLVGLVPAAQAAVGDITTVAGSGATGATNGGFAGDGGPATSALLRTVQGVATDSAGNLYLADGDNNRIRKVTPGGTITTVAGSGPSPGVGSFAGDGGPATEAKLFAPHSVAVDGAGNLYIADSGNSRVRKVNTSGVISTVAGNGALEYSGDGGPAVTAALRGPNGIDVDAAGNLYIADQGNLRVRKVDTNGIITTVAGNGLNEAASGDGGPPTAASVWPNHVALDGVGGFYISEAGNFRIRRVIAGVIVTVAGTAQAGFSGDGGPASAAKLDGLGGLDVDGAGNVFVSANNRVRKFVPSGNITTVAGNGTAGFSGDGGPATAAAMRPLGVAVGGGGDLVVADGSNNRARRVQGAATSPTTSTTTTTTTSPPPTTPPTTPPVTVPQTAGTRPLVFREGTWYLRDSLTSGVATSSFAYGNRTDIPVTGDWDGNGSVTVGVVRDGVWYLRNGAGGGVADVAAFGYGDPFDVAVTGDWDGNGSYTPGVVRNGTWYLRNSLTSGVADIVFGYGNAVDDFPLAGDWNGDGTSTAGVDRLGAWYLRNGLGGGAADVAAFGYGDTFDFPVVGDWNGDGTVTAGVFRGGTWYLRNAAGGGVADIGAFQFGDPGDIPLTWSS